MASFDIVGKLRISDPTENFKPYDEKKFDSGWVNRTLMFSVVSGNSIIPLRIQGGCYQDQHNDIYVVSKKVGDKKGELMKIPFKNRLKDKRLKNVAEFKKFVLDLENREIRSNIYYGQRQLEDKGKLSEKVTKELGIESVEDFEKLAADSNKKRKEFISEWDFAEIIYKLLQKEEFKNKKFHIRGNHVHEYSDSKNKWYDHFVPQKIYLADDDEEETAIEKVEIFFDKESLQANETKKKYYVNAFLKEYNNSVKEEVFVPYSFSFPMTADDDTSIEAKRSKRLVEIFSIDEEDTNEVYNTNVVNKLVYGAEVKDIVLEDLDETTQEDIEIGLITLEEVKAELGGSIYGDKIKEAQFKTFGLGFTKKKREATSYTSEDLIFRLNKDEEEEELESDEDALFPEVDDDDDLWN